MVGCLLWIGFHPRPPAFAQTIQQEMDQTMRQEAVDAQDLSDLLRETGDMESRQEAMDATVGQQGRELSSIQGELQVWGFLLAGFNVVGIGVTITKKKG